MAMNTFGDMARAYALRHQNTLLKKDIQTLNQELSTGKAADLASHLGGSYSRLTGIERDMRRLDGFKVTISEAEQFTELMQARLGQVNELSTGYARNLIAGDASSSDASSGALTAEGRMHFSTVVAMLNSEAAGRNLFSGDTTDVNPLVDAETFLAELETVVGGATTAADVQTALDTWFADPAGYDSFAYQGSTTAMSPLKMSQTSSVPLDIRADNQALKDTLKGLAMAAMAEAPGTALSPDDKSVSPIGHSPLGGRKRAHRPAGETRHFPGADRGVCATSPKRPGSTMPRARCCRSIRSRPPPSWKLRSSSSKVSMP